MKKVSAGTEHRELGSTAWFAVFQAQSVIAQLVEERLVRETGLPLAWFEVLLHLAGSPHGRLRMNDLAHGLVVSRSGLTRLIDRISSEGFVVRSACPSDRRVIHVEVTQAGRSKLAEAMPIHARAIEELFVRHLNSAEMKALVEPLKRVIEINGFSSMPCVSAIAKPARVPISAKAVS
ncbi:MAG: MarR family winged helix-turn-helix transcriptional regulator [Actinomycetota bacterium]